jgi:hypothetical protein
MHPARQKAPSPRWGITIYGCGPDEAPLFREMAPRFGISPTITEAAPSETNTDLALGMRCISVGHRTHITDPTLRAFRQAGVRYLSTRSIGVQRDLASWSTRNHGNRGEKSSRPLFDHGGLRLQVIPVRVVALHTEHEPYPNTYFDFPIT